MELIAYLTIPGDSTISVELVRASAYWGENPATGLPIPAVSHNQLCVIGWGGNSIASWDQSAIGSFGESVTTDIALTLGRAMIDDMRPLLVTNMEGNDNTWTQNVGGGDFMVLERSANVRERFVQARTYTYI